MIHGCEHNHVSITWHNDHPVSECPVCERDETIRRLRYQVELANNDVLHTAQALEVAVCNLRRRQERVEVLEKILSEKGPTP